MGSEAQGTNTAPQVLFSGGLTPWDSLLWALCAGAQQSGNLWAGRSPAGKKYCDKEVNKEGDPGKGQPVAHFPQQMLKSHWPEGLISEAVFLPTLSITTCKENQVPRRDWNSKTTEY